MCYACVMETGNTIYVDASNEEDARQRAFEEAVGGDGSTTCARIIALG